MGDGTLSQSIFLRRPSRLVDVIPAQNPHGCNCHCKCCKPPSPRKRPRNGEFAHDPLAPSHQHHDDHDGDRRYPLITALQYNARIGSKCMNVMATPPTVANAMTA